MLNNVARYTGLIITGMVLGFILRAHTMGKSAESCVIKTCRGHFTGPADINTIQLVEPVSGVLDSNFIKIFGLRNASRTLLWRSPPAPVWDIFFADIDGDGQDELAVCLSKAEPRDPVKDNRLQVYGWMHDGVYARWRGTFLSKPFERIAFGDVNGDGAEELISIERGRQNPGKVFLCVYCWNGFGFDLLAETDLENAPDTVNVTGDTHRQIELKFHNESVCYLFSGATLTAGDRYHEIR